MILITLIVCFVIKHPASTNHTTDSLGAADGILQSSDNSQLTKRISEKISEKEAQEQAQVVANSNVQSSTVTPSKSVYIDWLDYETNRRLEFTIKFYMNNDCSLSAAAGMAANGIIESGLDPMKTSNGVVATEKYIPIPEIAFGAYQLTGERQKVFVKFAKSIGKPVNDLEAQLMFSLHEPQVNSSFFDMRDRLKNVEQEAEADPTVSAPMRAAILFHGFTNKIKHNPVVAYVNPSRGYEGSNDSARKVVEERGRLAELIYDLYKDLYK